MIFIVSPDTAASPAPEVIQGMREEQAAAEEIIF